MASLEPGPPAPSARAPARPLRLHRPAPAAGREHASPAGGVHLVHGLPHDPAAPARAGDDLGVPARRRARPCERMADLPWHGRVPALLWLLRHVGGHGHRTRDAEHERAPDVAAGCRLRHRQGLARAGDVRVLAQPGRDLGMGSGGRLPGLLRASIGRTPGAVDPARDGGVLPDGRTSGPVRDARVRQPLRRRTHDERQRARAKVAPAGTSAAAPRAAAVPLDRQGSALGGGVDA